MSDKKNRVATMAATYAQKLKELDPKKKGKTIHKLPDISTPEMDEKLKKAKEKLRTFWED